MAGRTESFPIICATSCVISVRRCFIAGHCPHYWKRLSREVVPLASRSVSIIATVSHEEPLHYCISHPEEVKRIIANACRYVDAFRHRRREDLISTGVLYKYFVPTGQI